MRIDRVKLIAEMARQDIRAQELAKRANVSRSTVTAMRSGKSCCKNSVLHIAKALNCDVTEILEVNK